METLTVIQVAVELGVTPGRVRQLVGAGRLAASKFGKQLMIRRKDLSAVRVRVRTGRPKKAGLLKP